MGGTLAVTTYQAGKLLLLRADAPDRLIQLPRTLEKPMGMAVHPDGKRLAIACRKDVQTFANAPELAGNYPKNPGVYDALFLPRATYHTGPMDWHDLAWTDAGLFGVNTLFSCIAQITDEHHFTPVWTPPGNTPLSGEDRCHLNGLATRDGALAFATSFNRGTAAKSWRGRWKNQGLVWDLESGESCATDLSMPHSPRWHRGKLYVLQSATGSFGTVEPQTGQYQEIQNFGSFVRGLTLVEGVAFIGLSKVRSDSSSFADLNLANPHRCGVVAVDLETGSILGSLEWQNSVDELFEVHWLSAGRRINVLTATSEEHHFGVATPEASFWASNAEENPTN